LLIRTILASTKEHFSKLIRIHRDTLSNLTEKQLSGMPSNPTINPSEHDKDYVEDIVKKMKRMHEEIECLWKENHELEGKYASMLTTSAVSDNQLQNEKLQLMYDGLENQTKTLSTQLFTKQTELEECHGNYESY
ncbi:hypothetical protein BX666DRAFT_1943743, partial [Dichotomocladium elegans]